MAVRRHTAFTIVIFVRGIATSGCGIVHDRMTSFFFFHLIVVHKMAFVNPFFRFSKIGGKITGTHENERSDGVFQHVFPVARGDHAGFLSDRLRERP